MAIFIISSAGLVFHAWALPSVVVLCVLNARVCPGRGPVCPVMHADSLAPLLQSAKAYTRYGYALQDQDTHDLQDIQDHDQAIRDLQDTQDHDGGELPSMKHLTR